jgi:hypothetical protein
MKTMRTLFCQPENKHHRDLQEQKR